MFMPSPVVYASFNVQIVQGTTERQIRRLLTTMCKHIPGEKLLSTSVLLHLPDLYHRDDPEAAFQIVTGTRNLT